MHRKRVALLAASVATLGCDGFTPGLEQRPVLRAETEAVWLEVDLAGSGIRLGAKADGTEIGGLHVAAELEHGGSRELVTTLGQRWECESTAEAAGDERIECTTAMGSGLAVRLQLGLSSNAPERVDWHAELENASSSPIGVRKLLPFRAAAEQGGAVLLGASPDGVRILQNGRDELIDFHVDMLRGDTPLSDPDGLPPLMPYSSFSNGMTLAHDLDSGASLLAGFVELDWATPLVALAGDVEVAQPIEGRLPMTELLSEARYPSAVELAAGEIIDGGAAVFLLGMPSPFDALEAYAEAVAQHHDIVLPPRPLSGWDSWYTSFQNTDIDEAFVQHNADGLATLFGPYGIASMQLDLGWQDTWGDWNGSAGFPAGMGAIADYIRARGIMPELWMAPLSAEEASAIYQDHQDEWFVGKDTWGEALMDPDMHPLDLTRSDVIDHVRSLGQRVRAWGYESVKLDFAYYILVSVFPPDPHDTPTALMRRAVQAFREGLGADRYFINIAAGFPNIGLVDALRIGLDDWPCWEGGADCAAYGGATGIGAQGIKPAVLTTARRYWLNGRVWYNHLDQLFFRELTVAESRCFATLVALAGGMIALGEDTATLAPEHVDTYRRILPLLGHTARPTDLFRTEYPEVWHLPVESPSPGAHLVGLFHWGANRDLRTHPPARRADGAPLTHAVDLAALGLDANTDYVAYAFWRGQVLGQVRGTLQLELDPHTAEVVKLVPLPAEPAFVATNRHVLMGTELIGDVSFAGGELAGVARTTTGFEQTLVFWVPAGFAFVSASIDGVTDLQTQLQGSHVLVLTFTGPDDREHGFRVQFS